MARSVWKGPFVEESLMKKVDKYKDDPKKIPIKTWSRKSTILPLSLIHISEPRDGLLSRMPSSA